MIKQEVPSEDFLIAMAILAAYPPGAAVTIDEARTDPRVMQWIETLGSRRGDACSVVYEGEQAVGAAWTRLFDDCEVHGIVGILGTNSPALLIAVDPEHHGKGYGKLLIESLCEQLKSQGFEAVSLCVSRANSGAVSLYDHAGFITHSSDDKRILMIKSL